MGSFTKTFKDSYSAAQWTNTYTYPDEVKITGSTFTINQVKPTITSYRAWIASGTWSSNLVGRANVYGTILGSSSTFRIDETSWANKATKTFSLDYSDTKQTSSYFNTSNPNVRKVRVTMTHSGDGYVEDRKYYLSYSGSYGNTSSNLGYLVLEAPPTFDSTQVSFDTPYVYAGFTTASVTISNLSAKYGGNIASAVLKIGNQTASRTTNGVLSISLNTGGTFTPTVTVTDSRGQVTTKNLNAITVNTYVTPSALFSVERTLPTQTISTPAGEPYDEGESAVVTAKFDWTEAITTIAEPTIAVKDPNNLTVPVTKAWYKDRALTTPITDWSEITEDMQAYCLLTNAGHNAFNTQYSYQISLTPIDGLGGSGTTIMQTLGSAFYTVDFLAGGHGIAFGQASTQEGFFCNMGAHFVDNNKIMRALFDFVYPVGSYYETSDTSFNPNDVWGGTWVEDTAGRVLVSAGTNAGVTYSTGATGGNKDAIVPYHRHGVASFNFSGGPHSHSLDGTASSVASGSNYTRPRGAGTATANSYVTTSTTHTHTLPAHDTNYAGTSGNTTNANMQPYIVVKRWHRTA